MSDPPHGSAADPPELSTNPHSQAVASARDSAVRTAVNSLPPEYRTVVTLHYVGELTFPEIAGLLRLSVAAVNMRWHRAKKMLRDRLPEWVSNGEDLTVG